MACKRILRAENFCKGKRIPNRQVCSYNICSFPVIEKLEPGSPVV